MSDLPTRPVRVRPRFMSAGLFTLVLVAGFVGAGCQRSVDIKTAIQVTDVASGWFDAGIVDGKNKLVPSVTFRLRNTSDQDIDAVSVNLVFEFADNGEDYEEIFRQRIPFNNKQTELITFRAQAGYTGEPPQTRAEMLKHSSFRDMNAVVFVRQAAAQWVELHRVRIERQLLTQ
jgi:hypothetical protein